MTFSLSPLQHSADLALAYRLRLPLPAQASACLLLLHGVGGSETNLADLAYGVDANTLVVFARGPLTMAAGQFAWFRVSFTAQGPHIDAQEAEHSRQLLLQFMEQLQTAYAIPAQRSVIAGFSQGGIMSASVALSAPERLKGFAILSGRILPELEPHLASRDRLAHLHAFIAHGEFDSKLPVSWAERSDELLNMLGVARQTRLYPMDHGISAATQQDFLVWLQGVLPASSAEQPPIA